MNKGAKCIAISTGGEIEQPITRIDATQQLVFTQMLQQNAAATVDDTLGNAGRAGGEQDVQRMIEWQHRVVDGRR